MPIREFLNVAINGGARQVIAWGVSPQDWSPFITSPSEQIAAVPFGASPDFEPTPVADGMVAAFKIPQRRPSVRLTQLQISLAATSG